MTITSKFPGTCTGCGERFAAGTPVEWRKGTTGVRHATPQACAAARAGRAAAPPAVAALNLKPIADFLAAAQARGLKHPRARFLAPGGGELRLSLAGAKSRAPGSLQVIVADQWRGRVHADGTVAGPLGSDRALADALLRIAENPAEAAMAYGALMGRCSFCDLPLTDAGSVAVGYGPICARKWGLPHHPKGTPAPTRVPD
jgi:uncharacterized protein DUF6011